MDEKPNSSELPNPSTPNPPVAREMGTPGNRSSSAAPAPRRRFSKEAKKTVAHQVVMGMAYSEIASLHNADPQQINAMVRTDEMRDLIAEQRTRLLDSGSRIMFKFMMHADRLAEDQVNDALGSGPNHYKARTWILERVAPARSVSQQQVEVNHHITHEVMVGLGDALKEVNKAVAGRTGTGTGGIALLDGKSALPPADYDMDVDT
jgi:hypothetical protein